LNILRIKIRTAVSAYIVNVVSGSKIKEDKTINTSRKEANTKKVRERALDGVTVLEYCSMVSGPYCTKIMADLGAEVIKIESPVDGDTARRMPPFPGDKSHPEKSGLFFYLNTNKQGITLDPETPGY